MKDYNEMAQNVLDRAKQYHARRRAFMGRIGTGIACCCVAALLVLAVMNRTVDPVQSTTEYCIDTIPSQSNGIDLSGLQIKDNTFIFAMYDKGYKTIGELMAISPLVVRATPVSVESESAVAVCWVLEVAEASAPGTKRIYLRQLKDEYLLAQGQEYVLVLQEDHGENCYCIPGGGCGLFYIDPQTQAPEGKLLDSLLASSVHTGTDLTLERIYALLLQNLP